MRLRTTWLTPIVALAFAGLAACGGETDGTGEMEAGAEAEASGEAGGQTAETPGEASGVQISLAPRNESGIEGTATIQRGADTVHVSVSLMGLESGNSYPAHVHEGSCQEGGGVAAGLTSVEAGNGEGSSETRIPAGELSADGSYFVQAHLPDGTPAACGNVPAPGSGTSSGGSGSGSGGGTG